MNPGVQAVLKLSSLGFVFEVRGDRLRYRYQGSGEPDRDKVQPLLGLVKAHKPKVLTYLSRPIFPERVLTCYECGHFRAAINSPNPTQAWGFCQKRRKGRYGCAMACEAALEVEP
jgi:hypothetical protein